MSWLQRKQATCYLKAHPMVLLMHTRLERFCGAYVMLSMENLVYCDGNFIDENFKFPAAVKLNRFKTIYLPRIFNSKF